MKVGLCKGRHNIADVSDYIYPIIVDPTNLFELDKIATTYVLNLQIDSLDLYVTGLSVALVSVINICNKFNINLTLWHYDNTTNNYYPQRVY